MRARVSVTTLKRLSALEQASSSSRMLVAPPFVAARCGFPPLMPIDEWEVAASAAQEALVGATRDDPLAVVRLVDDGPDPMDVTHRYKPTHERQKRRRKQWTTN
jgi:hypothetical protein